MDSVILSRSEIVSTSPYKDVLVMMIEDGKVIQKPIHESSLIAYFIEDMFPDFNSYIITEGNDEIIVKLNAKV